jgi:hypothetical protein
MSSVCSTIFKLNIAKHPQLFTVGKATKSVPNININEGQPHASLPCKRTKMFQVPIIPTDDPFARNRLHHYTGATTHYYQENITRLEVEHDILGYYASATCDSFPWQYVPGSAVLVEGARIRHKYIYNPRVGVPFLPLLQKGWGSSDRDLH